MGKSLYCLIPNLVFQNDANQRNPVTKRVKMDQVNFGSTKLGSDITHKPDCSSEGAATSGEKIAGDYNQQ